MTIIKKLGIWILLLLSISLQGANCEQIIPPLIPDVNQNDSQISLTTPQDNNQIEIEIAIPKKRRFTEACRWISKIIFSQSPFDGDDHDNTFSRIAESWIDSRILY